MRLYNYMRKTIVKYIRLNVHKRQGYRIRVSLCNFKANRSNVSLAILELQNRSCLSDDSKENFNKNTFIDSKCFGLIILQYIFYGLNRKITTSFFTPCPLILLIRSTVRRGTTRRNRENPPGWQRRRTANVFVADTPGTHTRMKGVRRNRERATDVEGEAISQWHAAGTANDGGNREPTRDKTKVRELEEDGGAGGSGYMFGLRTDYWINTMQEGQCMDIKIGGIVLKMLIDSGAQCNIVDEETWKWCKQRGIVCESKRYVHKKIYAYGHAFELLGQFRCDVEAGSKRARANFVVLKGTTDIRVSNGERARNSKNRAESK